MKIINADLLIEKLENDIKSFEDEASDIILNCNDYEGADPLFVQIVATRRIIEFINQNAGENLPKGYPTSTKDINGKTICNGDFVTYDFDDNTCSFQVIFEENAFRQKIEPWNKTNGYPALEFGGIAEILRFKIIKDQNE
jgi:hypothetical protein